MKKNLTIVVGIIIFFTACDVLQEVVQNPAIFQSVEQTSNDLLKSFDRKSAISTTFDDAVYEVEVLNNFEPNDLAYRPLYVQPRAESQGYILKSGLYTIRNAKSFCLRGYSYGPSRGDGHLYAPLNGKKSDFIQAIIEHYEKKPEIPQQEIQVILWAIIAGADMNTLGNQYAKTLNELFTAEELLTFQAKDWLNGMADEQLNEFRNFALDKMSPKLQELINADEKIRSMVTQNKSFQEIEKVAIIAGVAPAKDMIREVTKGRWSYHPDGYFIRFFPYGYPQTRIDIFVPFEGTVQFDSKGDVLSVDNSSDIEKEVLYNPSSILAVPANRSGQKIGGFTNIPHSPCVPISDDGSVNFAVAPTVAAIAQPTDYTCWAAVTTMMYLWKRNMAPGNYDNIEKVLTMISNDKLIKYKEGLNDPANRDGALKGWEQESFFTEDLGLIQYTKCSTPISWIWCNKPVPSIYTATHDPILVVSTWLKSRPNTGSYY